MAAWGVRTEEEGRGSGDRPRASRAPMPEAADTVDLRIAKGTEEDAAWHGGGSRWDGIRRPKECSNKHQVSHESHFQEGG